MSLDFNTEQGNNLIRFLKGENSVAYGVLNGTEQVRVVSYDRNTRSVLVGGKPSKSCTYNPKTNCEKYYNTCIKENPMKFIKETKEKDCDEYIQKIYKDDGCGEKKFCTIGFICDETNICKPSKKKGGKLIKISINNISVNGKSLWGGGVVEDN
jgi:hypothetical protein